MTLSEIRDDLEWQAEMARDLADVRAGRLLPWRIAMLPLPEWAFALLYKIAPYTWGRGARRLGRHG